MMLAEKVKREFGKDEISAHKIREVYQLHWASCPNVSHLSDKNVAGFDVTVSMESTVVNDTHL
jgi:hypothetical protein